MDGLSPRKCRLCKTTNNFQDLRQCSNCGTEGEEHHYFCVKRCYKKDCRTLNCEKHPTCWILHLPPMEAEELRQDHQQISQLPQIYVNAVTYAERDPMTQRDLHENDRIAQWFIVKLGTTDKEQARLCVSDRFRRLCNPGVSGNRWSTSLYPSFVSFIGHTGTGKSTLVRAMILMGLLKADRSHSLREDLPDEDKIDAYTTLMDARRHGPVTRTGDLKHITDPTSSGVHLYRDRDEGATSHLNPILFADCEGFGGGIANTNSGRAFSDNLNPEEVSSNLLFDQPITSPGYGSKGKEGAELFYARFLYAFSDVVVFVTKEDQQFQENMQSLLEWAASAVNKSINHLAQKTLIIVRNMATLHDKIFYDAPFLKQSIFENLKPVWEGSQDLAKFRKTYNEKHKLAQRNIFTNKDFFDVFFQKVEVCYIPHKSQAPTYQIFIQYQKLRKLIKESSEAGQELRAKSWTQYNIPTLSHLLSRAFEHYRICEEPFDFYKAARKDNPNPVSVADHIANFIRHMQMSERNTTKMLTQVLSICLISCALRSFEQAWEPEDIFEKDLRQLCSVGIQIYCEKYQNCGYRFESGHQCITRRLGHKEHCDESGARISGTFDPSEYQEDSTKTINEIQDLFIATYKSLCAREREVPSLPDPAVLLRQREDVFERFADIWRMTKSNKTCFTCLQSVPDHVLSCGHGYCPDCVRDFGTKSESYEYGLRMDHCILCQTPWYDQHVQLIRFKPKCAGVRILTLDGGGVRGMMELALLEELEKRVGPKVAIRDLFDLIMGTSTGGIIALGLAMTGLSATEMKKEFFKLATATFKRRREGFVTVFDPLRLTSKAFMLLRIYESVYRTTPLKKGLQGLFGESLNLYSSAKVQNHQRSTRVAVTAMKDTAANRCLITNYNRPDFSGGEDFEREDEDRKEMKVWEAALATSAAPFYFHPFKKAETAKDYVDGALYANLPIQCALDEMANLWSTPDCDVSLDALVSVGTGVQKKEISIPKLLEIGGFKQICTNFHNNLDTQRLWQSFTESSTYAEHGHKIHRLNANINGDYVALDHYQKMEIMEAAVEEQVEEVGGPNPKPSRLAMSIARIADVLAASLFFFEPDATGTEDNFSGPSTRGRYEIKGSIRCRLARNSPELKQLLNNVTGFWKGEFTKRSSSVTSMDAHNNGWTKIEFPERLERGVRQGAAWFRIDCTISTQRTIDMRQVIAVSLSPPGEEKRHYSYERFPISGFPVTFNELWRRMKST